MKTIIVKTWKAVCAKCGYEWMARVPEPKQCPMCKQYHIDTPRKYEG